MLRLLVLLVVAGATVGMSGCQSCRQPECYSAGGGYYAGEAYGYEPNIIYDDPGWTQPALPQNTMPAQPIPRESVPQDFMPSRPGPDGMMPGGPMPGR